MSGEELDLEALADHFRSPDLNVRKDEDGRHYLRSSDLAQVANEETVRERAAELIQLLNVGARLLLGGNYFPVEIEGISWITMDGKRCHSVGGSLTASYQVRTQYLDATPEEAQSLVKALSARERLWRVVVLFSQSMDAKADNLKRFIFGWIALEVFVNKVFRSYELTYVNELTSSARVHGAQALPKVQRQEVA